MPQSLAHISLVVRDYDEAIAWFTDVIYRQPRRASLTCF